MEQGVAQAKFLRHCLVEVNHHVTVGPCDHTVKVGGCQEAIATWVQVGDLGHVPEVIEQDYVSGSQADRPVAGVFVKEVLDQMDYGRVTVLGHAHTPGTYTYNRQACVACMSLTMTRVLGSVVSCSVKQSVTKSRTARTKFGGRFHQNYGRFSLHQKFKFEK